MTDRAHLHARVLGIHPTTRGFGFAVLEGERLLLDRGLKIARRDKNARACAHAAALIRLYAPDALVFEDAAAGGSRRRLRVRKLFKELRRTAAHLGVPSCAISRRAVRDAFSPGSRATKHQIATAIAESFPELAPQLPPRRKAWMSERANMGIFDALSFALAYYKIPSEAAYERKTRRIRA